MNLTSATRKCFASAVVVAVAASSATAVTHTDTFTGGTNSAGWNLIDGGDIIESSGGNPGAWLHNPLYDTFAPILKTTPGTASPFVGNLRSTGVTNMSIDARTDHTDFGSNGFEYSLLLRNMRGTPNDFEDDDYAYYVGPVGPAEGQGWFNFSFDVPSQSTVPVPTGWKGGWAGDPENFRPGVDWNDVITQVDQVEFWWLNPAFFAIFQQWDVGVDNVSVTVPEPAALGLLSALGATALIRRRR